MGKRLTTEEFVKKAKAIHGNKYIYTKTVYIDGRTKVIVTCPIHGDFEVTPECHIAKTRPSGCKYCGYAEISRKKTMSTEEFIRRAKEIHGDKYIYTLVDYVGMKKKVKIICKIHGVFEQTPDDHLKGYGCKKCGIISRANKQRMTTE